MKKDEAATVKNANPTLNKRVSDPNANATVSCDAKLTLPERYESEESTVQTIEGKGLEREIAPTQKDETVQEKGGTDPNATITVSERQTNANETPTEDEVVKRAYGPDPNVPGHSSLVTAIADIVNESGCDERFINPLHYWPPQQADAISKVNIYLRCLLENTLKLSRYRRIPAGDLLDITNGYARVLNSRDFESSGHPYGDMLKSLHKKLSQVFAQYRNNPKLRLVLRMEEKAEIIAMLHEIGNTAPLKRFSELFKGA